MPSRKKTAGTSYHPSLAALEAASLRIKGGEATFALQVSTKYKRVVDLERLRHQDIVQKVGNLIALSEDEHSLRITEQKGTPALIPPTPPAPPSSLLLSLLLPPNKATTDFIANMEEMFQMLWVPKHGLAWAKFIWWTQNVRYLFSRLVMPIGGVILGAIKLLKMG
ncbi:hypothetical protein NKI86_20235 [Mesorhizobium sp. M0320]|uniref:hypothetical protein n=1 Tax=Mesorhizobium sp. M0320 TaxID=2956936 RepID=UPI00333CF5F1